MGASTNTVLFATGSTIDRTNDATKTGAPRVPVPQPRLKLDIIMLLLRIVYSRVCIMALGFKGLAALLWPHGRQKRELVRFTKCFPAVLAFALSGTVLAATSGPEPVPSLVGEPICGHLDELGISGLEWGLCMDPELKQLTDTVERKQGTLLRGLDRFAGDALITDWHRFIGDLRTQVGEKWFGEYVSDDVHSALLERVQFLDRIDTAPRVDLIGIWENSRAQLQITHNGDGGIDVRADDFMSCSAELTGHGPKANGVTVLLKGSEVPVELFASGNALRLSLDPDTYGKRYGCDASGLVGYYLPVTPPPSAQTP